MATITETQLRQQIRDILKDADLSQLSAKKIRRQLEEKFDADLTERKKEIDDLVMQLIEEKEENDKKKETKGKENGAKRPNSDKESEASDDDSDIDVPEDFSAPKKKKKSKVDDADMAQQLQEEENSSGRRSTRSGRGPSKKKEIKKRDKSEKSTKRPGTGYSKPCKLSPALAAVMGQDSMARSDVVKKMWEIVKSRELLDPKNKQFMLCDAELHKVFGRKRVRTFGMMKFLKDHIFNEDEVLEYDYE